jgi:hypothetical protein
MTGFFILVANRRRQIPPPLRGRGGRGRRVAPYRIGNILADSVTRFARFPLTLTLSRKERGNNPQGREGGFYRRRYSCKRRLNNKRNARRLSG